MSEAIAQSLITAGAAIVGALIGFGGSLLVSIRSARIGREQIRYAQRQERRAEVVSEMIARLLKPTDLLRAALKVEGLQRAKQLHPFLQSIQEANIYGRANVLWLSPSLSNTFSEAVEILREQGRKLSDTVTDTGDESGKREAAEEELRSWLNDGIVDFTANLVSKAQEGVELYGADEWADEPPRRRPWWKKALGG